MAFNLVGRPGERRAPRRRATRGSARRWRTPWTSRRWSNGSPAGTPSRDPRRSSRCTTTGIGNRRPRRPSGSTWTRRTGSSMRPDTSTPMATASVRRRTEGRRSSCKLLTASTDAALFKSAPFIEGWLESIGIDVSVTTMTDAKLYDIWLESLDWDMIIYAWGVGPDSGLHPVELHHRAMRVLERHVLREPRVRPALQGAADARSTETERQAIVIADAADHLPRTRPRSCSGTPTRSRRGAATDGPASSDGPSPTASVFWGNMYSARLVRPISDAAVAQPRRSRARRAGCGWSGRGRRGARDPGSPRLGDGDSTRTTPEGSERGRVALRRAGRCCRRSSPSSSCWCSTSSCSASCRAIPCVCSRVRRGIELSVEAQQELRRDWASTRPLPAQFVDYVGDLTRGELGTVVHLPGRVRDGRVPPSSCGPPSCWSGPPRS